MWDRGAVTTARQREPRATPPASPALPRMRPPGSSAGRPGPEGLLEPGGQGRARAAAADRRRTALVISGGGAKGAFAVGAIRYLYERFRRDGWFSIVGGSSTGALIAPLAALLAAPPQIAEEALETLVGSYSRLSSEDILDKKSLFELLRRRDSLSESGRLEALIQRWFRAEWFEWLRGPHAPECYVVYTNFQDGRKVTVCPRDPGMDLARWRRSVLASASVPVLMQGTVIDGEVCYDGGVRDILPFERAIQLGAQTIVPIFLDPEELDRSESNFRRIDKVLLRAIGILLHETMRNDHQLARLVSLGVAAREEITAALAGNDAALSAVRSVLARREYRELFGADKRVSRIVSGLRPERCLTHQLLRFDPPRMRQWMTWGYRRAAEVLPHSPFLQPASPPAPPGPACPTPSGLSLPAAGSGSEAARRGRAAVGRGGP